MSKQIITAVRFHRHNVSPTAPISVTHLASFIESAKSYSCYILIGIDASDTALTDYVERAFPAAFVFKPQQHTKADIPQPSEDQDELRGKLLLLHVQPYWKFSLCLNALLLASLRLEGDIILYASVETHVHPAEITKLLMPFSDPRTLVVGKAFSQHSFQRANTNETNATTVANTTTPFSFPYTLAPLSGLTSPWNTFALWSIRQLAQTGFLMVSDSNTIDGRSAIEEVPTIALHQHLHSTLGPRAYLMMTTKEGGWETEFVDPLRREWQKRKLESKDSSAQSHLEVLELDGWKKENEKKETVGWVWHVDAVEEN